MANAGGRCYTPLVGSVSISIMRISVLQHILISITVIFILFPQPAYLGSSKVLELTSESLPKVLGGPKQQPKIVELDDDDMPLLDVPSAKYWVILIYASWSVASRNFEAVLAQLSLQYDGDKVKFGTFTRKNSTWCQINQMLTNLSPRQN